MTYPTDVVKKSILQIIFISSRIYFTIRTVLLRVSSSKIYIPKNAFLVFLNDNILKYSWFVFFSTFLPCFHSNNFVLFSAKSTFSAKHRSQQCFWVFRNAHRFLSVCSKLQPPLSSKRISFSLSPLMGQALVYFIVNLNGTA